MKTIALKIATIVSSCLLALVAQAQESRQHPSTALVGNAEDVYKRQGTDGAPSRGDEPAPELDPVRPPEELLADLAEAIAAAEAMLSARGFRLLDISEKTGFARNKSIIDAKEVVNENDESRKRFQIVARECFKKFKACVNFPAVNGYRERFSALKVIYNSLDEDVQKADISEILRTLQGVVDTSIEAHDGVKEPARIYDISKIDFERLKQEFAHSGTKHSTVQSLKDAIQRKLALMLRQNPLRTDFQKHYEQLVADYNSEKDAVNIERVFAALLVLVDELDREQRRAAREGMTEETQALFDLLIKPDSVSYTHLDVYKRQLKLVRYFHKQSDWLLSRFPAAQLVPVPGLVKLVDRAELAANDYSLTPGRYVGVAPEVEDEDFDFEGVMRDIHIELAGLNAEAASLAAQIQANFLGLGL